MIDSYKIRRSIIVIVAATIMSIAIVLNTPIINSDVAKTAKPKVLGTSISAKHTLDSLPVKGRAPKTNYSRDQFGSGWTKVSGCDSRNIILHRDLVDVVVDDKCNVLSGLLADPYTGKVIKFSRGSGSSTDIQIDHTVSLSNAWQTGAQLMSNAMRIQLANDPLELLAVDGAANMQKSDGDAATWLPPNKSFRCSYVARQIAVKQKYDLWVTSSEKQAMALVLQKCPNQMLPNR